jgi:hypothetical protein
VILYRKAAPLRIRRTTAPEPPFWCATTIAPYAAKRATPVAIDYVSLRASGAEKLEVTVCESVRNELERAKHLDAPRLIDAAEAAELVFRRGAEALAFFDGDALFLTSTRGALPDTGNATVAIAAWPPDVAQLEPLFANARGSWGVAVPVVYPVTTELSTLDALADLAQQHGAAFFAAISIEVEATAKQALARSLQLGGDDDRYELLFHAAVEPIHIATERHIAALAHARGLHDFILPPRWNERSNWNAAVLLTLTASRMIAMDHDLDLAGLIARSARAVAELDKPLARIAEAASLGIIGGLDEVSVDVLTEWLGGGEAGFVSYINELWRLSRGGVE